VIYNIIAPEVLKENCLKFFGGDELATQVWMSKYALKSLKGEFVESSVEVRYMSIALELARIDKKYKEHGLNVDDYYYYLVNRMITPAGSGLTGIANPFSLTSLGNCFVVSLNKEDSYGSILKLDEKFVQICKRRGGIGTDLSDLRPANTFVTNAAGTSTGAISFIPRLSNSLREVAQEGRRGAGMLSLSVNYPDIEKFIDLKLDPKVATGANLSVRVTDEFMQAVECEGQHILRYPVTIPREEVVGEDSKNIRRKVAAKDIWNKMMKAAWQCAEPGILFWDKIIKESPADCYQLFESQSVNPCGELPLSQNDSCRLLSVNLTSFVLNPFTKDAAFDFVSFLTATNVATIMMDDIIDLELEKIDLIIAKINADKESDATKATELQLWKDIKQSCELGRRAGISAIGYGDMLAMLNKPYATYESNLFCKDIQYQFALQCYKTSIELAKQRGAFPVFNYELEDKNPFLNRLFANNLREYSEMKFVGRRNIALLTIPPSGSLSILLDNQTSGIEPAFALVYKRKRKVTNSDLNITFIDATGDCFQEYNVLHPGFQSWMEINGYMWEGESYENLLAIGKLSPYASCTANEIDPLKKIELQGMLQQYIDHSISVTTNLPETVTVDEVSKIYMAAWKAGCKGCTVYRDGSRDGILTTTPTKIKSEFEYKDSPKRPRDLPCDIFHPTIGGIRYVVLVGLYDNKPFEVFAFKNGQATLPLELTKGILRKQKSKHYNLLGEDKTLLIDNLGAQFGFPEWNSITRLLSWGLRHGGDVTFAAEQLNEAEGVVTDVSKVLARTLKKYVKPTRKLGQACPECGESMRMEGGCATCFNPECGYSKCS
jgi:ribonucleoside-diphosphate reductase alpha chain